VKLTKVAIFSLSAVLAQASFADPPSRGRPAPDRLELFPDPTGFFDTLSTAGGIDRRSAFFESLGTNDSRSAWFMIPTAVRSRVMRRPDSRLFRSIGGQFLPLTYYSWVPTEPRGDIVVH
jgi:hypothetical protein